MHPVFHQFHHIIPINMNSTSITRRGSFDNVQNKNNNDNNNNNIDNRGIGASSNNSDRRQEHWYNGVMNSLFGKKSETKKKILGKGIKAKYVKNDDEEDEDKEEDKEKSISDEEEDEVHGVPLNLNHSFIHVKEKEADTDVNNNGIETKAKKIKKKSTKKKKKTSIPIPIKHNSFMENEEEKEVEGDEINVSIVESEMKVHSIYDEAAEVYTLTYERSESFYDLFLASSVKESEEYKELLRDRERKRGTAIEVFSPNA